jgi:biotin transport system substrate-specific component
VILNLVSPLQLFWAIVGLLLTIGGTLLEAFIISPTFQWGQVGVQLHSLGITCQVGAVMLVGCLGGRNAALISQIAYLMLGLVWGNASIFAQGGGLDYALRPSFGYLLGFIPGAWVCGTLAFRFPKRLESLALTCLATLATIHAVGIVYLLLANQFKLPVDGTTEAALSQTFMNYSLAPLPGQLILVCAVTVISFILRQILFY